MNKSWPSSLKFWRLVFCNMRCGKGEERAGTLALHLMSAADEKDIVRSMIITSG